MTFTLGKGKSTWKGETIRLVLFTSEMTKIKVRLTKAATQDALRRPMKEKQMNLSRTYNDR